MSADDLSASRKLDRLLAQFVDAVFDDRDADALRLFIDAQALVDPRKYADGARSWVAAERALVAQLPPDVEDRSDRSAMTALARVRGRERQR